jgi:outer membrane cobalamin receptor
MRRAIHALLLLCPASPALLHAQERLIVTATRQPAPLDRLPYAATPIGPDDLAASESLADVLARLPDVHVQMPGGRSGFASLYLRGADPNFTTVMLEGVPLDSPVNSRGGAANLAAVPSAAIHRAELVAGPVSTLYGSGPLAGALNLLLAPPTGLTALTAGAAVGTQGDFAGFARWQGPLAGGIGGSLTGTADDAGTGEPESRFRARGLDLKLARLDGRGSLVAHYAATASRGFPDASGGFRRAVIRATERRESDELVLALDLPLVRAGLAGLGVAASFSSRGDRIDSPGVAPSAFAASGVPAGSDDLRYTRWIVRSDLRLDLGDWQATLGAQGQWERARSSGFLDFGVPVPAGFTATRTTMSAFGELDGSLGALAGNAGLRFDDISGIGSRLTGRAGLRLAVARDVALRASVGTAFKAPSFYALGNPFIGNPALRPESATSVELGLDWRGGEGDRLSLALFRTRYRDLIDFLPTDPPRLENRSRVTARGISASLSRRIVAGLSVMAGAQYVETVDAATGARLLGRPRWRLTAGLDWQAARRLRLAAHYAFTDERDDFAIPVGIATLPATHRLSASADRALGEGWRLRLDLDNLLGDAGEDAFGFPALPRRARLSIARRFD